MSMLLQTNSYLVPKEKRAEHVRLLRRFRQALTRLGCDEFNVYEQVDSNWGRGETTGRFIQMMRFRDRKHQQQVQQAERSDASAQAIIQEFCELINFPYQQQQGMFAVGFYASALPVVASEAEDEPAAASTGAEAATNGEPASAAAADVAVADELIPADEPTGEASEELSLIDEFDLPSADEPAEPHAGEKAPAAELPPL